MYKYSAKFKLSNLASKYFLEKENIIIQSKLDNLVPSSPSLAIPGN